MPKFLSYLVVRKSGTRNWEVMQPLVYESEVLSRLNPITVPVGFETDFASVPRGLWNLFPPDSDYTAAAVVHDWLYRKTAIDRKTCDAVFVEAMKACGTKFVKRTIMWAAVRIFGRWARKSI